MQIINTRQHPAYAKAAIEYLQNKWATPQSRPVYADSVTRSLAAKRPLPVWYLLLEEDKPIGCFGLITNDFISCGDLWPWLAALYIEPEYRGQNLGGLLVQRAQTDATSLGFDALYLCTDHMGYYEKFGFNYIATGYHPWGESSRVYECKLNNNQIEKN